MVRTHRQVRVLGLCVAALAAFVALGQRPAAAQSAPVNGGSVPVLTIGGGPSAPATTPRKPKKKRRLGLADALARHSHTTGDVYRRGGASGPRVVRIHELPAIEVRSGVRTRPLAFTTSLAVDADGAGGAWRHDPSGQPTTSLQSRSGRSLDPTKTPYFVLPIGFGHGVRLGDVAVVSYRGRLAYAIFGDSGPRGQIGEGSIALAKALRINASPTSGGVSGGVTFLVFPRSGKGTPLSNAEIERIGKRLLLAAGGQP